MTKELVKGSILMMHKPVTTTSPFLVPSHLFLNSNKILLTNITNFTFLVMARKATYIAYKYQ